MRKNSEAKAGGAIKKYERAIIPFQGGDGQQARMTTHPRVTEGDNT